MQFILYHSLICRAWPDSYRSRWHMNRAYPNRTMDELVLSELLDNILILYFIFILFIMYSRVGYTVHGPTPIKVADTWTAHILTQLWMSLFWVNYSNVFRYFYGSQCQWWIGWVLTRQFVAILLVDLATRWYWYLWYHEWRVFVSLIVYVH